MFVLGLYEMVVFKSVSLGTAGHLSLAVPERDMMEREQEAYTIRERALRLYTTHTSLCLFKSLSLSLSLSNLSLSLSLSLRVTLFFSFSLGTYKDARRKVIGTTS